MVNYKQIKFKGIDIDNLNANYFVKLNNSDYIFNVSWNKYCNTAFLNITDNNNNDIISGRALTNGLLIRNFNLPYNLSFINLNDENYEPTIDTISTEFAFVYLDYGEES